ncbi:tRNA (adenosine(37)-N6)-threonylcarbamoyltransferase complex ATPase subunit type 1 TsaE [Elusimicrobiota bacterium]
MLKNSDSAENTVEIGRQFAEIIEDKSQNIFLIGELGTGKTTFVKGLGKGLGIEEEIVSPSFQLVRKYSCRGGIFNHIDLYRLKDIKEILQLGWWELIEEGITAVEWADRAYDILPDEAIFLNIELIAEKERKIEIFRRKKDIFIN